MKNSGFMKVFKFSYEQALKSKSTKILMIILIVVALVFLPAKTLITNGFDDEEEEIVQIESVYVKTDNENLYNSITEVVLDNLETKAEFVMTSDEEYDSVIEKLESEDSNELYLDVKFDEDETSQNFGLSYKIVYGNGEKAKEMASSLEAVLAECSKDIVVSYYGISKEVAETLVPTEFETAVFDLDGNEVIDDSGLNDAEYWFTYGVIMVLIIMVSFIGSMAADGIVAEKANRVIEYIMITLKPMDLILGKVLSGMATLFTMLGSVLVAFIASTFINKAIDPNAENVIQMVKGFVEDGTLKGANIVNVLLVILIIFVGSYFYAILGALSGGMVSKVEEMAEGLKIYMIVFLIGAYAAMFMAMSANTAGSGWGAISYLVYMLPMSSMFIIPSYLLIGKVSALIALAALIVVALCGILLTMLAAKIFGQMLYHNGSPLKLKDIVSMTKEGKKNEK